MSIFDIVTECLNFREHLVECQYHSFYQVRLTSCSTLVLLQLIGSQLAGSIELARCRSMLSSSGRSDPPYSSSVSVLLSMTRRPVHKSDMRALIKQKLIGGTPNS